MTQNTQDAWPQFLEYAKTHCSHAAFGNWISPIRLLDVSDQEISLEIPNIFVQNYLLSNYHKELISFLPVRSDGNPAIRFVIASPSKPKNFTSFSKASSTPKEKNNSLSSLYEIKLNDNYRFNSFIDGASNQFPKAAALGVANRPGKSYNPLFIYGEVGVGKTHILHSIGHHIASKHKNLRVHCISTEGFINDLVDHLRKKSIDKMKRFYRSTVDVLLIDDIQFLQNRLNFEEEFATYLDVYKHQKKQIVITSDQPPAELKLSERMKQRMEVGLVTRMNMPDLETRVAILQNKADQKGLVIPPDVAFFIAERVQNSIRQLEGVINQLSAHCRMVNLVVTKEMVEQTLSHILQPLTTQKKISVDEILKSVSSVFGVNISDLNSKSRARNFVIPRQVAMYLAKTLAKDSLPTLAQLFGKKTHSTILHAFKSIEDKLKKDQKLRGQVEMIQQTLLS